MSKKGVQSKQSKVFSQNEVSEKKSSRVVDIITIMGKIFSGLFSFLLFVFILFSFAGLLTPASDLELGNGNIAVVPIKGVIATADSSSLLSGKLTDSSKIVSLIKKINESSEIKAILLEIDSPGGSPVASEEIADALHKFNKPTVAVIRETGASGAYWIATAADKIFASKMSVTGSIGVTASSLEYGGLLKDYNVTYRRLVAGKYKDAGSPYRSLTNEEKDLYQNILDKIRDNFIKTVAQNRNLSKAKVEEFATGFVFLGEEAQKLGLIDEIGSKDDAVSYLEKKLNLTAKLAEVKSKKGLLDSFSARFDEFFYAMGQGVGKALSAEKGVEIIT